MSTERVEIPAPAVSSEPTPVASKPKKAGPRASNDPRKKRPVAKPKAASKAKKADPETAKTGHLKNLQRKIHQRLNWYLFQVKGAV